MCIFLSHLCICNMYATSKCQVIADFDATLTKYSVDGQRGHSMLYLFCYTWDMVNVSFISDSSFSNTVIPNIDTCVSYDRISRPY